MDEDEGRVMIVRRLAEATIHEVEGECSKCHETCATSRVDWESIQQLAAETGGQAHMLCLQCYTARVDSGEFSHSVRITDSQVEYVSQLTGLPHDVVRQMAADITSRVCKTAARNLN